MSLANPLNPGTVKPGCWKRKGSDEDSDDSNSRCKKQKYSWYFTLESESPQPTSSDEDESIYSAQANETEFARDTSDTSTTCATSSDEFLDGEYEPASISTEENPFVDCLTSSDPELQISRGAANWAGAVAVIYDSDVDVADGSDDTLTSIDSEIGHADYWTCIQCNNSNNNPLFRYCEKCYQERKVFLPPRPKGRRRKRVSKKRCIRAAASTVEGGGEALASQDSGICSGAGSQLALAFELESAESEKTWEIRNADGENCVKIDTGEKNESEKTKIVGGATTTTMEKGGEFSDSSDATERIDQPSKSGKRRKSNDGDNCLICTVGPKNGAFVHGRDSHICCCYRCAMRVWKTTKHCPICNRRVTDVLKAYYA